MIFSNRTSSCPLVLLLITDLAFVINSVQHPEQNYEQHHEAKDKKNSQPDYLDLSYGINNQTLHWISMHDVSYKVIASGYKPRGLNKTGTYHIKMDRLELDLHSGTHMDAPIHFAEGKWSINEIPFDRLLNVPTYVVDLSDNCRNDRKYQFTREDLEKFEKKRQSRIANNSVVLIYTGISESWSKGAAEYFGGDLKNLSDLKIPGFSKEAASFLVNDRAIVGVGLDAPSADGSSSFDASNNMDPIAHEIFCGANVYILENVNSNLKQLINSTFIRISSLPLPIYTASGSPVRLVAQTNEYSADQCLLYQPSSQTSGAAPFAEAEINFNFICMFVCITLLTFTIVYQK